MLYTLCFFFSSKCSLFHNANLFGSCIVHILYTRCAKIKKKNNSGAKGLNVHGTHDVGIHRLVSFVRPILLDIGCRKSSREFDAP